MIKKLLTLAGYAVAPKKTYIAKHPIQAVKAKVATEGVKSIARKNAGTIATAAAVAVAVPMAALIVTRLRGRD